MPNLPPLSNDKKAAESVLSSKSASTSPVDEILLPASAIRDALVAIGSYPILVLDVQL